MQEGQGRIDVAALLIRLLLFEKYILDTASFSDIANLVRLFGADDVLELLRSDAIELNYDTARIASWNPTSQGIEKCVHSLFTVSVDDWPILVQEKLQLFEQLVGSIPQGKVDALRDEMSKRLIPQRSDAGIFAIRQLYADVRLNSPNLKLAINTALAKKLGTWVATGEIHVHFQEIGPDLISVDNNIGKLCSLSAEQVFDVVSAGLRAVGDLNKRIEDMQAHEALCGVRDEDFHLLDSKLNFLMANLAPQQQEHGFGRVVELSGMPAIGHAVSEGRLSLSRLLEIRDTPEYREFRRWLRTTDKMSDQDIIEQLRSLRAKLSSLSHSAMEKGLIFLFNTAIGVAHPVVGVTIGVLDTFILDRLLKKRGPAFFINKLYPSVFREKT